MNIIVTLISSSIHTEKTSVLGDPLTPCIICLYQRYLSLSSLSQKELVVAFTLEFCGWTVSFLPLSGLGAKFHKLVGAAARSKPAFSQLKSEQHHHMSQGHAWEREGVRDIPWKEGERGGGERFGCWLGEAAEGGEGDEG